MDRENYVACPFCYSALPENKEAVLDYCVNCSSEFNVALRVIEWEVQMQQPIVKKL